MGGVEGYFVGDVVERFVDLNFEGIVYFVVNDYIIGELIFEYFNFDEIIDIVNVYLCVLILDEVWFIRIKNGVE